MLKGELSDAVILGVSSIEQLESNLDVIEKGPLPSEVAAALDKVYGELGTDEIPYHL